MMKKQDQLWRFSFGEYGRRVRVFEQYAGSNLYITFGKANPRSLGHKDRARAREEENR